MADTKRCPECGYPHRCVKQAAGRLYSITTEEREALREAMEALESEAARMANEAEQRPSERADALAAVADSDAKIDTLRALLNRLM